MIRRHVAAILIALTACRGAERHVAVSDAALVIERPYVVPGAGNAPGVLYADLRAGADVDTLRGIAVADSAATLHDASMQVLRELPVSATRVTRLSPGGVHAMFAPSGRALTRGDSVLVTFTFAHRGRVTQAARVIDYADVDTATAPRPER